MAHAAPADRIQYLAELGQGSNVDHRGTEFTQELLNDLCSAVKHPLGGPPRFGVGDFREATFSEYATFGSASFQGGALFSEAIFSDECQFWDSTFKEIADFSGTTFTGFARFGDVHFAPSTTFAGAKFESGTHFNGANFPSDVSFRDAQFCGATNFQEVTYGGKSDYSKAHFSSAANFMDADFNKSSWFDQCIFNGSAHFDAAHFRGDARFVRTSFKGGVTFTGTDLSSAGLFVGAEFDEKVAIGPLTCTGRLSFDNAVFRQWVTIHASASHVSCCRSRFEEPVTFALREASVDLTDVLLLHSCTVKIGHNADGNRHRVSIAAGMSPRDPTPAIVSLSGADAALILLSDVDLTACSFEGTHHLDQLRLEGSWQLHTTPQGWRRGYFIPMRWAKRQIIEEERKWRALRYLPRYHRLDWGLPPDRPEYVPSLPALAAIYRQLRKAREDAKDEPGAADFYYGEMEMRRFSKGWKSAERWLLQLYWLLSGYGLRASRALGWLALAMMTTILLMMGFGLPQDSPKQEATGVVPPGGGKVTFEIDKEDPRNPTGDHFTGERFDKALSVTLNSVVFRSSGEDLTTAGGYIEMASRFSEPVLLGLAALAIRGRVKR
ncbi:pentapeptide repeat-containing protein [Streptomyces sp. NPDC005244]|uniref:pentapeptide repeat-containing protein n=1 Tax=Streptomyces sp. NPDC005244 TaxID=3364708 RepID=UPI00368F2796